MGETSAHFVKGYNTENCGNIYAFVAERSIDVTNTHGRVGLVIPISSFATARMEQLQKYCAFKCSKLWLSSYGIRPSKLFEGAEQRLSILLSQVVNLKNEAVVHTTKYVRWNAEERETLLSLLSYHNVTGVIRKVGYTKISTSLERLLMQRMPAKRLGLHFDDKSNTLIYWHRIPGYFIKSVDFVPYFCSDRDGQKKSEDYKIFGARDSIQPEVILSLLNSSLFYWFWFSVSEGYHCGKHEVLEFPFDAEPLTAPALASLRNHASDLMTHLKANSERKIRNQKTTVVEYDEFSPASAKPIIDEIDRVLATHYGFTDEETDFIINYDIKYRMGKGGGE